MELLFVNMAGYSLPRTGMQELIERIVTNGGRCADFPSRFVIPEGMKDNDYNYQRKLVDAGDEFFDSILGSEVHSNFDLKLALGTKELRTNVQNLRKLHGFLLEDGQRIEGLHCAMNDLMDFEIYCMRRGRNFDVPPCVLNHLVNEALDDYEEYYDYDDLGEV